MGRAPALPSTRVAPTCSAICRSVNGPALSKKSACRCCMGHPLARIDVHLHATVCRLNKAGSFDAERTSTGARHAASFVRERRSHAVRYTNACADEQGSDISGLDAFG